MLCSKTNGALAIETEPCTHAGAASFAWAKMAEMTRAIFWWNVLAYKLGVNY